ncbi:protein phosphatase 1 regulatory subunit 1C isoform X2 [Oryzias melastigma]|uniref:protein phosphatase 1 regulatory subunit 1C isoform X2 n=1 Tax=Oryzias melastigma TaxID=30732 RepID=UPI000CF80768|nr:protein phosphatase 1 regulatory subunit 1C isoform X2 [Oryzias melastigma]
MVQAAAAVHQRRFRTRWFFKMAAESLAAALSISDNGPIRKRSIPSSLSAPLLLPLLSSLSPFFRLSSICGSVIMEPSSPKKIQFAAPPLQGQLDPQAAEQIRRRRPTPATLQIYRQPGSDAADQHNASGDSQASHAFQKKQSTYDSPTVKGKLEGAVLEEEEEA